MDECGTTSQWLGIHSLDVHKLNLNIKFGEENTYLINFLNVAMAIHLFIILKHIYTRFDEISSFRNKEISLHPVLLG
jgi:large-conductance mechanosensitive channel